MGKGLIHIYCGDGKGKTTAAFGLLLRAVGHNRKVLVCQLLKDGTSGEIASLQYLKQAEVIEGFHYSGFVDPKDMKAMEAAKDQQQKKLLLAIEKMATGDYDLVIIDELCTAVSLGIIEKDLAAALIEQKPGHTELVLTGRNPSPYLVEAADYISQIDCVRHPYMKGTEAREGVEW